MTVETLSALAQQKARGSAALEKQWIVALHRLASSGVSDEVFTRLAGAGGSPAAISRLARLLSEDAEADAATLFANCDASCHGLDQWIDALDALYGWLEKRSRHETFSKSLGYLSCASQAAPDARLAWVAIQMLDQYGMDK
jgi:hypothetical protein